MSDFATLWFWRSTPLNETWTKVESFATDEHPKPSTVESDMRPTAADAFSWSSLDDAGHLHVGITPEHLSNAPELWWVLRDEPHPLGDTMCLIGFADDTFGDGTVLTIREAAAAGLSGARTQVCALRWGKGDPKMEQIYVNPDYRRRRVSIKAINVADMVNEAGRFGGYLYGGAELTPDGEKLAEAWKHSTRLQPQTMSHSSLEPDPSQP